MAEMITRCPQCDTAFRITPGHLRSARGSVRCGSCLQVFNARENLTENSLKALAAAEADTAAAPEPTPAAATPAPTAPAPTAPAPATPAQAKPAESPPEPDSDDLLISDDMELADDFLSLIHI